MSRKFWTRSRRLCVSLAFDVDKQHYSPYAHGMRTITELAARMIAAVRDNLVILAGPDDEDEA